MDLYMWKDISHVNPLARLGLAMLLSVFLILFIRLRGFFRHLAVTVSDHTIDNMQSLNIALHSLSCSLV